MMWILSRKLVHQRGLSMLHLGRNAIARWMLQGILAGGVAILAVPSTGWADVVNIDPALAIFAPGVLGTSGTPWIITQGSSSIVQTTAPQFTSPPGPGAGASVAS